MLSKTTRRVLWAAAGLLAAVLCFLVVLRGDYTLAALWMPAVALILFAAMTARVWARGDFQKERHDGAA